eukprot:TRINITY_DN18545_c1_g1_i1.p1 TRINITY_DN18545_c1_g1~~TRINITY_DN18545_c1_g1_i1.p1  ORF type:complete len:1331 (+),score=477.31 TRINITY_DN18545_c1_g1_i1:94-4086(+)
MDTPQRAVLPLPKPRVLVWDDESPLWPLIEDQSSTQVSQTPVELPPHNKTYVIRKLVLRFETQSGPSAVDGGALAHLRPYVHLRLINAHTCPDIKTLRASLDQWAARLQDEERMVVLIHPTLVQPAPQEAQQEDKSKKSKSFMPDMLMHRATPSEQAERKVKDLEEDLRRKFKGGREGAVHRYQQWHDLMREVRERVMRAFQQRVMQCHVDATEAREPSARVPWVKVLAPSDEQALLLRQFGLVEEARCVYVALEDELAVHSDDVRRRSFRQVPWAVSPSHASSLLNFTELRLAAFRRSLRGEGPPPTELEVYLFLLSLQMDISLGTGQKGVPGLRRHFQEKWFPRLRAAAKRHGMPADAELLLHLSIFLAVVRELDYWDAARRRTRLGASGRDSQSSFPHGGEDAQSQSQLGMSHNDPAAPLPLHSPAATGGVELGVYSPTGGPLLEFPAALATSSHGWRTISGSTVAASMVRHTSVATVPVTMSGSTALSLTTAASPGSPVREVVDITSPKGRSVVTPVCADLMYQAREALLALGAICGGLRLLPEAPPTPEEGSPGGPLAKRVSQSGDFPWPQEDPAAPLRMAALSGAAAFGEYAAAVTYEAMRRHFEIGVLSIVHGLAHQTAPTLIAQGRLLDAQDMLAGTAAYFEAHQWGQLAAHCRQQLLNCLDRLRRHSSEIAPEVLPVLQQRWLGTALAVVAQEDYGNEQRGAVWARAAEQMHETADAGAAPIELPLAPLVVVEELGQGKRPGAADIVVEATIRVRAPAPWTLSRVALTLVGKDAKGGRAREFVVESSAVVTDPGGGAVRVLMSGQARKEGNYVPASLRVEAPGVVLSAPVGDLAAARQVVASSAVLQSAAGAAPSLLDGGQVVVPQMPPIAAFRAQPLSDHPFGAGCGGPLQVALALSAVLPPLPGAASADGSMSAARHSTAVQADPIIGELPLCPPPGAVAWLAVDLISAGDRECPAAAAASPQDREGHEMVPDADGGATLIPSGGGDAGAVELDEAEGEESWARLEEVQGAAGKGVLQRRLLAVVPTRQQPQRAELRLRVPLQAASCGRELHLRLVHLHPFATARGLQPVTERVRVPCAQPFRMAAHVRADDEGAVVELAAESLLSFPVEVRTFELCLPESAPYSVVRAPPNRGRGTAAHRQGSFSSRIFLLRSEPREGADPPGEQCTGQARLSYARAGADGGANTYLSVPVRWNVPKRSLLQATVALVPPPPAAAPPEVAVGRPARFDITVRCSEGPRDLWCTLQHREYWMGLGPLKKRLKVAPGEPGMLSVHLVALMAGHLRSPSVQLREYTAAGGEPGPPVAVTVQTTTHRIFAVS